MQTILCVFMTALFAFTVLSDEFDPDYTYVDFNRTYPRPYTRDIWTMHEAAFNKTYAKLIKLKK